jgi:DNA-binding winged helix-turn-helix (wHTH) protein
MSNNIHSKPHSTSVDAYRFGPWRLVTAGRILERDGERVPLTPKVIDTLFVLVQNAGSVVTKEDLMRQVWPDVTVVESGLTRNMSVLRKALESGTSETVIETIPRRGYRFLASVTVEQTEIVEPSVQRPRPRGWWQILLSLLASISSPLKGKEMIHNELS